MALKIKSINWRNIRLPLGVNGNLFTVQSELQKHKEWSYVQYEQSTYKLIISNGICKLSVYLSTMTVQTALNHPKKGKTQLTRKKVTGNEFGKILKNPRVHTNKGHY